MPEPFPWDRLPRYGAEQAHATNRCVELLGGDGIAVAASVKAQLGELGFETFDAALAFVGTHRGTVFQPEIGASFLTNLLVPGLGSMGAIAVDPTLVDAALSRLLGTETAGIAIDEWDFGLVAWLLLRLQAALTRHGARPLVVVAERRPPQRVIEEVCGPHMVHEIVLEVRIDGGRGWVRLFLPESLLVHLLDGVDASDATSELAAGVPANLALGVGRVRLTGAELRGLSPGDVVVLDEDGLVARNGAARVGFGEAWLDATVRRDGDRWLFEIGELFERRRPKETTMGEGSTATTQVTHDTNVEVEAVVGRTTITFAELSRLRPGQIFVADRSVGDPVDVVANGAVVGRGELVDVEGRLGIRILTLGRP